MRTLLRCLVLLCVGFNIGCADTPVPADVNIISIARMKGKTSGNTDTSLVYVCYGSDITLVSNYHESVLAVVKDGTPLTEVPFYEDPTELNAEENCKFFTGDISTYFNVDLVFILEGRDSDKNSLIQGQAAFTIPGSYLEDDAVTSSQTVGKRGTTFEQKAASKDSLRLYLSTALGDWQVCSGDLLLVPLCDNAKTTCYAIEVGTVTHYSLCIKATDESGAFLSTASFDVAKVDAQEENVTEARLIYGYTIEYLEKPTTVDTHIMITTEEPKLEIVPYISGVINFDICKTKDCTLKDYPSINSDGIEILFMKVEDNAATTSDIISFKDYNILGTHLGAEVVETYWKRGIEAEKKTFFGASIATLDTPDTSVQTAAIDCSKDDPDGADQTYCFAYFIKLNQTKYQVTVAPATDASLPNSGVDLILKNQITTDPISTETSQQKRIMGITLLQNPSYGYGILQVCYNPFEGNHNNTRHEAIVIDEDGHWIKIHQPTHGDNKMQCFSSVNLLTSSLRITKDTKLTVVVVERELDGYQILASGQAVADLSGLRVIKPETDNSSEGYTRIIAIVGAAFGGVACMMALIAAVILFVMKRNANKDGLQYPLHRTSIENSDIVHGLENPYSTM